MPVKPAPGEVLVEKKETTVRPATKGTERDASMPGRSDFMEWVAQLPKSEWERLELSVRFYRGSDTRGQFCEKLYEPPFSLEWIQEKYGGGDYYVMGYEGAQLRYSLIVRIFGKPKDPDEVSAQDHSMPKGEMGMILKAFQDSQRELIAELRAARGGDAASNAVNQAVNLSGQVFSSAVQSATTAIAKVTGNGGAPQNDPMRDMMMQFMQAAIAKMMSPTDPIDTFSKMATAMGNLGFGPKGEGRSSGIAQELLRMAPTVLSEINKGIVSMATMREQELRAAILARGAQTQVPQPQPDAVPHQQPQQIIESPPPNPAPAAPPAEPRQPEIGFWEFIEGGIVNVLRDPTKPIEHAANEALIFLDTSGAGQFVDAMINAGEPGLLDLFRTRPILMQIPQNPRLTEFIKKFLELARESRQPEPASPGA
jgi:hypothetical protein